MRLKFYLRGLGLGILVTTILLLISFHIHGTSISDDEIKRRAAQLGMVMPEEEVEDGSEAFLPQDPAEDTQAKTPGEDPQAADQPKDDKNGTATAPPEQGDTPDDGQPQSIVITVKTGYGCREIAEELMSHGLIEDSEDFRKYMNQNGYDSMIRAGKFDIPYGAEYKEIADILTKKD